MGLEINTIREYFGKKYNEEELQNFYKILQTKIYTYKGTSYPLEICLSSNYGDSSLLGTLSFVELDRNGYPRYKGVVVQGKNSLTYSTTLEFSNRDSRWIFTLTPEGITIPMEISSLPTTSYDPTSVDYDEISRPTTGACNV